MVPLRQACLGVFLSLTAKATLVPAGDSKLQFSQLSPEIRENIYKGFSILDYAALLRTSVNSRSLIGATDFFERKLLEESLVQLRFWRDQSVDDLSILEQIYGAVRTVVRSRSALPIVFKTTSEPNISDVASRFVNAFRDCSSYHEGLAWRKNCMAALISGNILPKIFTAISEDFRNENFNLFLQAAALNGDMQTLDFLLQMKSLNRDHLMVKVFLDDIIRNGSISGFQAVKSRYPQLDQWYSSVLCSAVVYQQKSLFAHVMACMTENLDKKKTLAEEVFVAAFSYGGLKMIQFIAEDYLPFFSKEVIAWCLDQASKDGNLPLVKYFLGRGKEKFVLSESHIGGMIINAAKENRVAVLQFLLYEMLIQPDMDFADSLTAAFEKASVKGHVAVLDLLLRKRADEAVPRTNFDPFQLHSMVMGVVRTGKPDILRYFFAKQLENDPRFQALDFAANDNEALLLACKNKDRLDVVKFFLCRDEASNEYVFPNIDPGAQENSALLFACERGLVEIVEELLRLDDNGAQVHSTVIPAAHDNEPLLLACQGGHTSIVELCLVGL